MNTKSTRYTLALLSALSLWAGVDVGRAKAADCTDAIVTAIMDKGTSVCGGKVGFKTSYAPTGNPWICTGNDSQGRIAMSAFLSGKKVAFEFTDTTGEACKPPSPFGKTIRYIQIYN